MKEYPAYQQLDSGNCRKLEQVGPYRIIRPALNAFWKPSMPEKEGAKADAVFSRESSGGGVWDWKRGKAPDHTGGEWIVRWGGVNLTVKPTNFGHLGFFAEQAGNWARLRKCVSAMENARTLNLFAYSGGATLAMAQAGADVTHLDASKGIIDWAKKNQAINPETANRIRWICDDAMKFVSREQRRNSKYNGIVLDPPSFGRGAQGQVWKIEDGLADILHNCKKILDLSKPYFILLSCHSQGFSASSLGRCLADVFPEAEKQIESGEMLIPESNGKVQPAGLYAGVFNAR